MTSSVLKEIQRDKVKDYRVPRMQMLGALYLGSTQLFDDLFQTERRAEEE